MNPNIYEMLPKMLQNRLDNYSERCCCRATGYLVNCATDPGSPRGTGLGGRSQIFVPTAHSRTWNSTLLYGYRIRIQHQRTMFLLLGSDSLSSYELQLMEGSPISSPTILHELQKEESTSSTI